mmetsp:Transcript_17999/g.47876  ORF Transcript_17999/g.47876 Transcript_17999/m.47876 type:complete len:272 (+) Transcript_17999:133-948(+)
MHKGATAKTNQSHPIRTTCLIDLKLLGGEGEIHAALEEAGAGGIATRLAQVGRQKHVEGRSALKVREAGVTSGQRANALGIGSGKALLERGHPDRSRVGSDLGGHERRPHGRDIGRTRSHLNNDLERLRGLLERERPNSVDVIDVRERGECWHRRQVAGHEEALAPGEAALAGNDGGGLGAGAGRDLDGGELAEVGGAVELEGALGGDGAGQGAAGGAGAAGAGGGCDAAGLGPGGNDAGAGGTVVLLTGAGALRGGESEEDNEGEGKFGH